MTQRARTLVTKVRKESGSGDGIDAFLQEYSLDAGGIILMCLAEALLRIPDAETADALIRTSSPAPTGRPIFARATPPW